MKASLIATPQVLKPDYLSAKGNPAILAGFQLSSVSDALERTRGFPSPDYSGFGFFFEKIFGLLNSPAWRKRDK
jgi:hypothetical protein